MKSICLCTVATIALVIPFAAAAQTTPADSTAPPADKAVAAPAAENTPQSDDIVVTAQRRSQNLQDVPIAVTAISGDSLATARVNSVTDLQTAVPGLAVSPLNRPATSTIFTLRGIGTTASNAGLEGAVGYTVDGVYRARSGTGLGDFSDIESVEVLRGPQGTLFGKNTSAGVIQVTTRRPDLSTYGGYVEGTAGNYNLARFAGVINVPLVADQVALRINGSYASRDGFIKDPSADTSYNNRNRFNISGKLLFQISPDVDALLIADYSQAKENCCQSIRLSNGLVNGQPAPYVAFLAARAAADGASYPTAPDITNYVTSVNAPVRDDNSDRGLQLQINAKIGAAKLTSISSVRNFKDQSINDTDFTGADLNHQLTGFALRVFSQELRLQGSAFDNRVDWLVGGFYSNERIRYSESFNLGVDSNAYFTFLSPALAGLYPQSNNAFGATAHQTSNSFALFTHNIIRITDKLQFTAGLRYTNESKSADDTPFFNIPTAILPRAAIAPLAAPTYAYDLKNTEGAFSGTAVLNYHWTRDIMTYASYSRGYKAGGFSLARDAGGAIYSRSPACTSTGAIALPTSPFGPIYRCDPLNPRFKPETVDSFELGLRSQFFDHRLTFNLTLFDSEYTNLQLSTFNGLSFSITNAGTARTSGVELETGLKIATGVRIGGNITYLDTRYGDGVPSVATGEPPLAGQRLSQAPTWSGAINANLETPVSDKISIYARPEIYFRTWTLNNNRVASDGSLLKLPGYALLNLTGGLKFGSQADVSIFCRNCTNKHAIDAVFPSVAQTGGIDAFVTNPAEYGVTVRFNF